MRSCGTNLPPACLAFGLVISLGPLGDKIKRFVSLDDLSIFSPSATLFLSVLPDHLVLGEEKRIALTFVAPPVSRILGRVASELNLVRINHVPDKEPIKSTNKRQSDGALI